MAKLKTVCVKCQRFYRPKKNGVSFIEAMPRGGDRRPKPGLAEPDGWTPYKLWAADLWECPGCGNQIIPELSAGLAPLNEHYRPDFEKDVDNYKPIVTVNDC